VIEIFYYLSIFFVKISIMFLYLRLGKACGASKFRFRLPDESQLSTSERYSTEEHS
jgi:hypothetical protein